MLFPSKCMSSCLVDVNTRWCKILRTSIKSEKREGLSRDPREGSVHLPNVYGKWDSFLTISLWSRIYCANWEIKAPNEVTWQRSLLLVRVREESKSRSGLLYSPAQHIPPLFVWNILNRNEFLLHILLYFFLFNTFTFRKLENEGMVQKEEITEISFGNH